MVSSGRLVKNKIWLGGCSGIVVGPLVVTAGAMEVKTKMINTRINMMINKRINLMINKRINLTINKRINLTINKRIHGTKHHKTINRHNIKKQQINKKIDKQI